MDCYPAESELNICTCRSLNIFGSFWNCVVVQKGMIRP
jgi:hypothetical protein